MSWKDSHSPWARKLRRRAIGEATFGVTFTIVSIAVSIAFYRLDLPIPFGWQLTTILAPGIFMLIPGLVMLNLAMRARYVLRAVPQHAGAICPFCRRIMESSGDTDEPSSERRYRCTRCHVEHSTPDLQDFWVWFSLHPPSAGRWYIENHPRRDTLFGRWRRRFYSKEKKPLLRSVLTIAAWAIPTMFILWWLLGMMMLKVAIGGLVGVSFAFIFSRFMLIREGHQRFCVYCNYEVAPEQDPIRCPECGADWTQPGALIVGQCQTRTPRQRFGIATGMAVLLLLFFSDILGLFSLINRTFPTRLLVSQVTTGRFPKQEWDALANRELTQDERINLARGLLQRRERRDRLESEATQWFLDQHAAGTLPNEILDEFFAGIIRAHFNAPEHAIVGEPFPVGIDAINRFSTFRYVGTTPLLYFAGFTIDGEYFCCRAERAMHLFNFAVTDFLADSGHAAPSTQIIPQVPGPLVIRAHYWIAEVPTASGFQQIQWSADGTPAWPQGTLWSYRQTIEHTVNIVPPDAAE